MFSIERWQSQKKAEIEKEEKNLKIKEKRKNIEKEQIQKLKEKADEIKNIDLMIENLTRKLLTFPPSDIKRINILSDIENLAKQKEELKNEEEKLELSEWEIIL